jgi:TolB-like protein
MNGSKEKKMRRIIVLSIILLTTALCTTCATSPEPSKPPKVTTILPVKGRTLTAADIKNAISKHQQTVVDVLPARARIAVLDIDSYDGELGVFTTEEIIMFLVKAKKFSVIDRDSIETLLKEQNFQMSGAVSDNTAVSIGKFLGASVIITGIIHQRYGQIDFSLKILDVETAEILDLISIPIWEK